MLRSASRAATWRPHSGHSITSLLPSRPAEFSHRLLRGLLSTRSRRRVEMSEDMAFTVKVYPALADALSIGEVPNVR
jgi:hypothetical protein